MSVTTSSTILGSCTAQMAVGSSAINLYGAPAMFLVAVSVHPQTAPASSAAHVSTTTDMLWCSTSRDPTHCGLETFLKVGTVGTSLDPVQPTCRPSQGRGWGPGFGLACCMGRTSKRLVFTGRELQVPHHRHLDVPQPPCCTLQRVLCVCVGERVGVNAVAKATTQGQKHVCCVALHRALLSVSYCTCRASLRCCDRVADNTLVLRCIAHLEGFAVCEVDEWQGCVLCERSCFSLCGGTFVHVVDTVCGLSSTLPRLRLHQMHTVSRVACACECVVLSTRVFDGVWLLLRDGKEVKRDISLSCGATRDWTLCQAHRVAPLAH